MNTNSEQLEKIRKMEASIGGAKGRVTPADIAAGTGLALAEVKELLNTLLEKYDSRVNLDPSTGELFFNFKYPLKSRKSKSLREIVQIVLNFLWKSFKAVFKVMIGLVLIFYTSVFLFVLLIALFGGKNESSKKGSGNLALGLIKGIFEMMRWGAWTKASVQIATDAQGNHYKQYEPEKNKGKGFIKSIYDFVFGPERPKLDELSDTKEAIAFIRSNSGKITSADIIALTGVDFATAESRLAEYAGKFHGELRVNESGVVIAEFPELKSTMNENYGGGKVEYYKDEVEAPYLLTGNTTSKNTIIIIMNSFNLLMATLMAESFISNNGFAYSESFIGWIVFWAVIPMAISLMYFILPTIRYFYVRGKNQARDINIIRKKIVGLIIEFRDFAFKKEDFEGFISPKKHGYLEKVLQQLVIELQGTIEIDESTGKPIYIFSRIANELSAQ